MDRATIGRYDVIAELGRGGFATVYRARDPMLDREVAVKVLHPNLARDPDLRERFVREGRALARVRHPNVVMVFDAGESADAVYLAMELIAGDSLAALRKEQPLPLDRTLSVVRQIAPALDAIHAAGLVHRDVKPANIMVEQPDWRRVVLLDLGIARTMDSATLTTSGMLVGTPSFLAPEQVDGSRSIGPATDVYQLGATVYALLTGRPPFDGTTAEVLYAVVHTPPPDIREVRPDLADPVAAAISRAMARYPAGRFVRATDLLAALEERSSEHASLPETITLPLSRQAGAGSGPTRPVDPHTVASGNPAATAPATRSISRKALLLSATGGMAAVAVGLWLYGSREGRSGVTASGASDAVPTTKADTAALTGTTQTAVPATPVSSPTVSSSPTPTPSTQLVLPTEPMTQIPIPGGLPAEQRRVLEAINRHSAAFIAAVRGPDIRPLHDAATGKTLAAWTAYINGLLSRSEYDEAELLSISLVELHQEGPDAVVARTRERWRNVRHDSSTRRRLSGVETVQDVEYQIARLDGRWMIRDGLLTVLSATPI